MPDRKISIKTTEEKPRRPIKKDDSKLRLEYVPSRDSVEVNATREKVDTLPSYKRGGLVKKSGLARLHKGEMVLRKSPRNRSRGGGR